MTLVAGVDSSTQSCKVLVCDLERGTVVRSGGARHPAGTEVDPERWWTALLEAVDAAGGLADVSAISVAGQQHGMVALDRTGAVVRPALLWNDTRSAAAAQAIAEELGVAELVRRTGSAPVASFTSTKLRWLRDAEPDAASRVAAVALPHDWLTWRLLGHGPGHGDLAALTTDRSDASGTGYWSRETGDWDRALLRAALGHDALLPRVLGPTERAGITAAVGPLPRGLAVAAGAGDNAAAALGLGAADGEAVVSIGTSGTAFVRSSTSVQDPTGAVAGFAAADGAWLPLVATLNAARVLDSTAALLGVDHGELSRLALAAAPGSGGLVLQPWFEGERTPNLPDATATLFGMTIASTTREHLARAAFEGVLCGLAEALDAVVRATRVPVARVLLTGGGARSAAMAPIAAQVLGARVEVPAEGEHVALGAARQAAWMLTGAMPGWPVDIVGAVDADPRPEVRAAYAARR